MKCEICNLNFNESQMLEHERHGLICNNCDCNLLEIKNNIRIDQTEEDYIKSFKELLE